MMMSFLERVMRGLTFVFVLSAALGKPFVHIFFGLLNFFRFMKDVMNSIWVTPYLVFNFNFLTSIWHMSILSLPLLGTMAVFTGAVMALQTHNALSQFGNVDGYVSIVVALSLVRELGPVLAGIMVAGRCGSALAAELCTLRLTEQFDAFKSLFVDPLAYCVAGNILAAIIALPIVSGVFSVIGMVSGGVMAQYMWDEPWICYLQNSFDALNGLDWMFLMLKSSVFGVLLGSIGCYQGCSMPAQASGVGSGVTQTVIITGLMILLTNMILTWVFVNWISVT